ncbi:hypothetical protein C8J57DRAFT_1502850 [Mycena rebaudengoi]|nr:hypothetical protein C8J57DRAFT_1502850 [Mycena rebaudengoi]
MELDFVTLDVFKASSHELSTTPTDSARFTTIFLFLPSFGGAQIRLHATHEASASAVGMYTGVSDARIDLMLFFLSGNPATASNFRGEDATLLCHLAPLAKAYGFRIYIARLNHVSSTMQEVQHDYKEYFEMTDDIDMEDLYMSDNPAVNYNRGKLRTLGNVRVMKQTAVLGLATELVTTDTHLQEQLMDINLNEDVQIENDGLYSATVRYKHIRAVTVLFIAS